jgi:hypothetical protein
VPVLLDTDHLSVLEWEEQPACQRYVESDAFPSNDPVAVILTQQSSST